MDIANRTIYITGGTSGMGLMAAKMLAGLGAHIVVFNLNGDEAAMQSIADARRAPSQRIGFFQVNIADRAAVLSTVGDAVIKCGAPDVMINMAGIGGAAAFTEMKADLFDRIMQVNVQGTRNVVEAVLPHMLARKEGKIVLVGSMGGIIPVYGYTAYGASKFAVVGFAQCLRYELKPEWISVACFCPGEVETPGLAGERKSLPPASAALKKIGGTLPVEVAVRGLIEGIQKDQFMIIPGFKVKLTYWLYRITPTMIWNAITDAIVSKALRGPSKS